MLLERDNRLVAAHRESVPALLLDCECVKESIPKTKQGLFA
jgi:hypothetical protein